MEASSSDWDKEVGKSYPLPTESLSWLYHLKDKLAATNLLLELDGDKDFQNKIKSTDQLVTKAASKRFNDFQGYISGLEESLYKLIVHKAIESSKFTVEKYDEESLKYYPDLDSKKVTRSGLVERKTFK